MQDHIPGPDHFHDGLPTLGERTLSLEVGGLAIRYEGLSDEVYAVIGGALPPASCRR